MEILRTFAASSFSLLSIRRICSCCGKVCLVVSPCALIFRATFWFSYTWGVFLVMLPVVFHVPSYCVSAASRRLWQTFSYRICWVAINLREKNQALTHGICIPHRRRHTHTHTQVLRIHSRMPYSFQIHQQHIHILWNRKRARFTQALSCNALH